MKIITGVVAAKRVAGIRGDPCGAVRYSLMMICLCLSFDELKKCRVKR